MREVWYWFGGVLSDAEREVGGSVDWRGLQDYVEERLRHLALIVGQPGWEEAARAERDAVGLHAGVNVTLSADAADQRLLGVIGGALSMGARMLAGI